MFFILGTKEIKNLDKGKISQSNFYVKKTQEKR